jgi:outer membrane protein TolC
MEERNMSGAHDPREEFVNQLELQLRADLRRRDLAAGTRAWMPQSRLAVASTIVAVVIVSMAMGGGVVAAAYQARLSEQRDLLLGAVEQRAAIAKQQLALATEQLQNVRERVSIGTELPESVADAQFKVTEAEAELKSIELDIAEIRATGRAPLSALSAPPISGRDFVTERLRVQMAVPAAARERGKVRVQALQSSFDVGMASAIDVEAARTMLIEFESAVEMFQRKIGIRQTFLKGAIPAAVADLRALEAEADLRQTVLARRIESAQRQVSDLKARLEIGTANPLNIAKAEMELQGLRAQLAKASYDLHLVRSQIGK